MRDVASDGLEPSCSLASLLFLTPFSSVFSRSMAIRRGMLLVRNRRAAEPIQNLLEGGPTNRLGDEMVHASIHALFDIAFFGESGKCHYGR